MGIMSKKTQCGICKVEESNFRCILCQSFFCGKCNAIFHDEVCSGKHIPQQAGSEIC